MSDNKTQRESKAIGFIIIFLLTMVASGCGCKLSVGDVVKDKLIGDIGVVEAINGAGSWTSECTVAVRYDYYRSYWVHSFTLEKEVSK